MDAAARATLLRGEYVMPKGYPVYRRSFAEIAAVWARGGITSNVALARRLGVHPNTIGLWKREKQEFRDAIEGGEDTLIMAAHSQVERAVAEGDMATVRWLLERRSQAYKPKVNVEHSYDADSLQALLDQQADMNAEALRDSGLQLEGMSASQRAIAAAKARGFIQ